jgi:prepilin-type N-terminal cleavage/methylation domain-containing protein
MKKNGAPIMNGTRGVTLVELMMAMAIFVVFMSVFYPMLATFTGGFAASEAHRALKTESGAALDHMGYRLIENKRLFLENTNDRLFFARIVLSTATQRTPIPVTKLPIAEANGSLCTSSSTFHPNSVGDALFFASFDSPIDQETMFATETVRIDTFRFNAYYLGAMGTQKTIKVGNTGAGTRTLWRWQSIRYVDYNRVRAIANNPVKKAYLLRNMNLQKGVRYAFDASTTNVNAAFYIISDSGTIYNDPNHMIQQYQCEQIANPMTGVAGGGWHCGVMHNSTGTLTNTPVPLFATWSSNFPFGFEVVVVGTPSARQIYLRLVLVAEGSFKGYVTHAATKLVTVRDIW